MINKKRVILTGLILCAFSMGYAKGPKKDYLVKIHTTFGDMYVILYDETPKHKENFLKLAREGFYDGTTFHRIIKEFMIQGGDANSKDDNPNNDGAGDIGYTTEAEFNPRLFHQKGALAAARSNNPEKRSSGSQFYIVHGKKQSTSELDQLVSTKTKQSLTLTFRKYLSDTKNDSLQVLLRQLSQSRNFAGIEQLMKDSRPLMEKEYGPLPSYEYSEKQKKIYSELGGAPFLDQDYTVFGIVIKGLEVIDTIANQKKNGRDKPDVDIRVTVSTEELKRKKITKLYGYVYPESKK